MLPSRFYVSLFAIIYWATPLIYFVVKRNESAKRFLFLVCDCALGFAVSVIISCSVLVRCTGVHVPEDEGFDLTLWFDKGWFADAEHEFQILLVVSLQDMATRIAFPLGILVAMSGTKALIEGASPRPSDPAHASTWTNCTHENAKPWQQDGH